MINGLKYLYFLVEKVPNDFIGHSGDCNLCCHKIVPTEHFFLKCTITLIYIPLHLSSAIKMQPFTLQSDYNLLWGGKNILKAGFFKFFILQ